MAVGCLLAAVPARAIEPATVVIVFDGSGSMWGKIAGSNAPKFAVAREALRQSLSKLKQDTRIGLVGFGHRRKGDCSDAEIMLTPDAAATGRITSVLEKLNPKGRGPLVLALTQAAELLSGERGRQSLILVHDDPDNCQQDVCAAAEAIHRMSPRLAIHVVSMGLKKADADRMSCIAAPTGGKLYDTQDASSLTAAIDEAVRLASLETPGPPATKPAVARSEPALRPKAPETGPPGLRLAATLAANAEPLDRPVHWRIFRDLPQADAPMVETTEAFPSLELAPGPYVVEARYGLAEARQPVEVVADKPTPATVAFNAGAISLTTTPFKEAKASATALFSVEEQPAAASTARRRVLWLGPANATELVLPAGNYKITLQDGNFRIERAVTIGSGTHSEVAIPFTAGRLRLQARDHERAEVSDGVLFQVLEDDPTAPDGRKEVARSASTTAEFTLLPGTYYVTARKGAAEIRERVALGRGDEISKTLVLGLARLSLTARLEGSVETLGEQASYRVLWINGEPREVARSGQATLRLELPAGRYRVESQIGSQNARVARDIELGAGAENSLVFDHAAGSIRLKLAEAGGGRPSSDAFWEIRDGSSRIVSRTMQAEPRLLLAAGRYTVRIETRERRFERAFEVKGGETRTLEFAPE